MFDGQDITDKESHEIARLGVARTFQMLRIFQGMSVIENMLVGHHAMIRYGMPSAVVGSPAVWREERRVRAEMMELLAFIGLADYAEMPAGELSGGQRRLLALGRAMAAKPKLLMLDEPGAGLSPANVDILLDTVRALRERFGLTVIIIEHILKLVMETCETVSVLEHGEKIAEGPPDADQGQSPRHRGLSRQGDEGRGSARLYEVRVMRTPCSRSRTSSAATAACRSSTARASRSTRGQIVALLGGNGTGKSTLLKATSGLLKPWSGSITFDGERIDGLRPDAIVRRGLVQVTQGKEAFPGMTVEENLKLGAYVVRDRAKTAAALERVYSYFPILKEKRQQLSGTLSGGQLQMVCIGRGLMSSPKMIMLDEPSAALAPQIVMDIFRTIHRITRDGMTVLMVEQNVRMALLLATYGYVIKDGVIALEGPGREDDPRRQCAPVLSRRHGRQPRGASCENGRLMWITSSTS